MENTWAHKQLKQRREWWFSLRFLILTSNLSPTRKRNSRKAVLKILQVYKKIKEQAYVQTYITDIMGLYFTPEYDPRFFKWCACTTPAYRKDNFKIQFQYFEKLLLSTAYQVFFICNGSKVGRSPKIHVKYCQCCVGAT